MQKKNTFFARKKRLNSFRKWQNAVFKKKKKETVAFLSSQSGRSGPRNSIGFVKNCDECDLASEIRFTFLFECFKLSSSRRVQCKLHRNNICFHFFCHFRFLFEFRSNSDSIPIAQNFYSNVDPLAMNRPTKEEWNWPFRSFSLSPSVPDWFVFAVHSNICLPFWYDYFHLLLYFFFFFFIPRPHVSMFQTMMRRRPSTKGQIGQITTEQQQ